MSTFHKGQRVCSGAGTPHTAWATVVRQEGDYVWIEVDKTGKTVKVLALTLTAKA